MLAWLIDNINFLTFLLGTIALGCFVQAWRTSRPRYAVAGLAVIGFIAMLWLLGFAIVTDRQQIVRTLDAMARAIEDQKPDKLFPHLAKDFRFGKLERDDLQQRVTRAIHGHKIAIKIWDQRVESAGEGYEVAFNFRVDAEGDAALVASAKSKFVREGGTWKAQRLETYRIGSTERQHIPGID